MINSDKEHSKEQIQTNPNLKKELDKYIKTVGHDLEKEIKNRDIVQHNLNKEGLRKTSDLFGKGFTYFFGFEQKFTHDFLFGYLPEQIKKYIKIIIPFLLMIFVLVFPIEMDIQVRKALALFICISVLWALESLSMIVTALLIPVLGVMLGLIKNTNPFNSFSNPIIYLLLSGLIIAQAFRKHELDKLLSLKVLALSNGSLKRVLFYLMSISALLGMWMSNTATIALLIPVILSISTKLKTKTEKNYTAMFLLSTGFASAIGGLSTILGGNPNAITAAFLNNVINFEFIDWSIIGFPISLILFFVAYLSFSNIYKLKNEKVALGELKKEARKRKLNDQQKKLLLIFIPTILAWLFGAKLFSFLNLPNDFFRTEVIGLTSAILLFTFKILSWDDVRGIPWEIFLLMGGALTLGQILIDTGVASLLAIGVFSKISFFPSPLILFFIILFSMVLSNLVNNSSTTIILVPVLMQAFSFLNIDLRLMAMAVAMATAISPLTPIAMPGFSLIYGTGKVKRSEMINTGLKIALVCAPILTLLLSFFNWFLI